MCVDPSFVIHLVGREKEYHHPIKKVWHLKCGKMVDVEKGRIIHFFLKIEEGCLGLKSYKYAIFFAITQ